MLFNFLKNKKPSQLELQTRVHRALFDCVWVFAKIKEEYNQDTWVNLNLWIIKDTYEVKAIFNHEPQENFTQFDPNETREIVKGSLKPPYSKKTMPAVIRTVQLSGGDELTMMMLNQAANQLLKSSAAKDSSELVLKTLEMATFNVFMGAQLFDFCE